MRRALIIVGKAPEAGRTKTRLVPPLSAEEAAALYRGFLLDAVHLGLELGWEQVSLIHPRGARSALQELVPSEVRLLEQRGYGLADALPSAFETVLGDGFDRGVLIGSDNPTLPRQPIEAACAALDDHDLSIGPTEDGGYYLIGMREPQRGVFEGIDWSTERVYGQTIARAERLGLRVQRMSAWYDVDGPADLERLQCDLENSPACVAPHTRSVMNHLGNAVASR